MKFRSPIDLDDIQLYMNETHMTSHKSLFMTNVNGISRFFHPMWSWMKFWENYQQIKSNNVDVSPCEYGHDWSSEFFSLPRLPQQLQSIIQLTWIMTLFKLDIFSPHHTQCELNKMNSRHFRWSLSRLHLTLSTRQHPVLRICHQNQSNQLRSWVQRVNHWCQQRQQHRCRWQLATFSINRINFFLQRFKLLFVFNDEIQ